VLANDYRAAVVDLSLDDQQVRMIMAARTLQILWQEGERTRTRLLSGKRGRKPWIGTVVVIDEAHLFAPAVASDPQQQLVSQRIERFADQGKKFNLYLILVTQQPGKLNPRILAECNNRIILRMNERTSLKVLEDTYGGIGGRYDGALTFAQGEALIEGALLSDEMPPAALPRAIRFERARTKEGGGTPSKAWARSKHPNKQNG
jgi:DNA helicase HerA-like ATPase